MVQSMCSVPSPQRDVHIVLSTEGVPVNTSTTDASSWRLNEHLSQQGTQVGPTLLVTQCRVILFYQLKTLFITITSTSHKGAL